MQSTTLSVSLSPNLRSGSLDKDLIFNETIGATFDWKALVFKHPYETEGQVLATREQLESLHELILLIRLANPRISKGARKHHEELQPPFAELL